MHACQVSAAIDAIAAAVGAGRRQLERRFRATLGRSPLDQIHLARLAIAQEQLQAGSSVAAAAAAANWSVDALADACRTWLGTTPSDLASVAKSVEACRR